MAESKQLRDKVYQFIFRVGKDGEEELLQKKELKMNVFGDVDIRVAKKYMKDGNQLQVWLDRADGTMKIVTVRELRTPRSENERV